MPTPNRVRTVIGWLSWRPRGVERFAGHESVQLAAADERTTHRATCATGIPNQAEAQHQWSDWQGLGQGLAARKRLPPLEAQQRQPQAVQAAAVPASGAAWLYTQGDGLYHLNTAQVAANLAPRWRKHALGSDKASRWL